MAPSSPASSVTRARSASREISWKSLSVTLDSLYSVRDRLEADQCPDLARLRYIDAAVLQTPPRF